MSTLDNFTTWLGAHNQGRVFPAVDSRRHERVEVDRIKTAALFLNTKLVDYCCIVENISPGGVSLRIDEVVADDAVQTGDELVACIDDGQGRSFCRKAKVCWVDVRQESLALGIAYAEHIHFDPEQHTLNFRDVRIDPSCALMINPQMALRRHVLPFALIDGVIQVACSANDHGAGQQTIERLLKDPVQFWPVDPDALDESLRDIFGDGQGAIPGQNVAADATAMSDDILYAAYLHRASDIHIDPGSSALCIRFRVDGGLEVYAEWPSRTHTELVNRFKVLAGLDIAEKRAPQDGRFTHQFPGNGRSVDVRVASLPTKYGERLTLRLLALQTASLTLDRLGLDSAHRKTIENFLRRSQGMMILTGPTGSGKTTTLYAAIRMLLAERNLNIMTIEDPIEYAIDGVAQCEVDDADKVSFDTALRSILRHDPDVVMIGEIRDHETADIALKAALTGHLVLGTLHTNSAAAAITRLLDMRVDRYLVAATLRLSVAQRLCRKLCPHCRASRRLTKREAIYIRRLDLAGQTVYEPDGCIYCGGRGFNGRIGLYEMLELNTDWAREVVEGAGEEKIVANMREAGVRLLLDDAITKLLDGTIHISDVMQIAASW